MKYWILIGLLSLRSFAFAGETIGNDCPRLQLVLDPQLSADVVDQAWASGESPMATPAVLALFGCKGEVLDRLSLAAPLARLDPIPLRGTHVRTYLVTVDLTASAGSYSGPLTMPVEIINHQIKLAKARAANGRSEQINLALTGKAAWKKLVVNSHDDLFAVRCQPTGKGFKTTYYHYRSTRHGWKVQMRSESGFWESDDEFPSLKHFP